MTGRRDEGWSARRGRLMIVARGEKSDPQKFMVNVCLQERAFGYLLQALGYGAFAL